MSSIAMAAAKGGDLIRFIQLSRRLSFRQSVAAIELNHSFNPTHR